MQVQGWGGRDVQLASRLILSTFSDNYSHFSQQNIQGKFEIYLTDPKEKKVYASIWSECEDFIAGVTSLRKCYY